jgi:hypothetical protein
MTSSITARPEATLRGNYVLLSADTLHLLLPQHEVGAAEFLHGVLEASNEPGLLTLAGDDSHRRYAALSRQMTLLPHCPRERFLVAPLGDDDELGWCWDELRILIDVELRPQRLPNVLIAPNTPVDRYVEFDGKLAYLCTARQLRSFALGPRN